VGEASGSFGRRNNTFHLAKRIELGPITTEGGALKVASSHQKMAQVQVNGYVKALEGSATRIPGK